MKEKKLQVAVGDTVIVTGYHPKNPATEAAVTKVGRKYVYINEHEAFDLISGREHTTRGIARMLYTREGWAAHQRRKEVVRRLQTDHFIVPRTASDFRQDTDTLQAVLALLDANLAET